ncbi:hypothetical protein YC2023_023562 [Brassica napus]
MKMEFNGSLGFVMCVGLLSLEKERGYVLEDIWTFSIKQNGVCLKMKFSIKKMESYLKCIWKT